ncbi:trypsin-1-like [Scylla paramamosain]|uniref:trypsin-1-like n=1 Tax=Scylla paramamosain TaxID=85552 RepID=UPI003083602F
MRCALLSLIVFMTCIWGSINAWDIPQAKKIQLSVFNLSRGNGSHVQPKEGTRQSSVECGTHSLSSGSTTIIMSPNYPKKYLNNYNCNWVFVPPAGSALSLSCQAFDVKASRLCKRDYLLVKDDAGLYEKLCGSEPFRIDDIEGNLDIIFKTNRWGKATGFTCEIETTSAAVSGSTSSPTASTNPSSEDDCSCGVRNTAIRIVGGVETEKNEYPWQVALVSRNGNRPFCGGSIISDQWILTAAHCVNSATPSGDEVIIGEHDWTEAAETSTTKRLRISRAIRHPNYSSSTLNNDLALLQLAERIVFPSNNKVAPVCLPEPDNLYEDVDAIVTGWGTLSSGGSQPKKLQEVTVPTMTNDQCKATGYAASEISDNMICAGVSEGGKDSCQGDSGGPMVTLAESGKMKQIGVVSWGYGCASARFPGVYTRVGNYVSWIRGNISGSTCSPSA